MRHPAVFLVVLLLAGASPARGGDTGFVEPGPNDKCRVCGMFAARYPKWIAEVVFKDGKYAVFDGPKDMFRYYFDMGRYDKSRSREDVAGIFVTEYYTTKRIPAADALFVLGSDVPGPMGEELIPVGTRGEAEVFMKDHKGRKILAFDQVTPAEIPGMKALHGGR